MKNKFGGQKLGGYKSERPNSFKKASGYKKFGDHKSGGPNRFKTSTGSTKANKFASSKKFVATKKFAAVKATIKGPSPIPTKDPNAFPMRINKYLAMKNYSTRRGADEIIEKKLVSINGRIAELGDKVNETDVVQVRSNRKPEEYVYYAYNKPRGVSTDDNRKGTKSISQSIPLTGVFPVGSLDTNAQGLIILTNDRRIIDRLQNPGHAHIKEYSVKTLAHIHPKFKERMAAGVILGNGEKVSASVHVTSELTCAIRVSTHNNPVREMCSLLGTELESLTRTHILNIGLNKLPENGYRKIDGEELATFLKGLGL